jgi:hypothetical protein
VRPAHGLGQVRRGRCRTIHRRGRDSVATRKESAARTRTRESNVSTHGMLTLQALLLTCSLLIVLGMVVSVMYLAALRSKLETEPVLVEPTDEPL